MQQSTTGTLTAKVWLIDTQDELKKYLESVLDIEVVRTLDRRQQSTTGTLTAKVWLIDTQDELKKAHTPQVGIRTSRLARTLVGSSPTTGTSYSQV
ncbi:hypothetical protein AVEN_250043-1 [Araneus ventricosus]|uniref:Uncharacterized protein n=1 Tax=Araneus ventricosus TaxID=182803 RepID=A0A4Y2QC11_ARAVE|nr:hypothetical protein AVEN_250043-1 [Araneus ventricosus]